MMKRWQLALTILVAGAVACGTLIGIDDPTLRARVDSEAGSPDTDGDGAPPVAPDVPDFQRGVFVSALRGTNSAECGESSTPCLTIAKGLSRFVALQPSGKTTVYVASGEYTEAVSLVRGVVLEGGWDAIGTPPSLRWTRAASGARATVIRPLTESTSVLADGLDTLVVVRRLTVRSKLSADAGQSLYGILVRGTAATLASMRLEFVDIDVGAGGDGVDGVDGDAGAPGPVDAAAPCALSSTGAEGGAGPPGSAGDGGVFVADGYVAPLPPDGGVGGTGALGEVGIAPVPPVPEDKCNCKKGGTCVPQIGTSVGTEGFPGCPGFGGAGGSAGSAGGGSVALYAWRAQVDVSAGSMRSGAGGAGGKGGKGGAGGGGGYGFAGEPGNVCGGGGCPACGIILQGPAGQPGGKGGTGGPGGTGAGAQGGPSCAIVQAAGAVVNVTGTALAHATAATSGSGAAAPIAADLCP